MTELTFTKSFLSTLDSRPLKLQPDHIANPKTLTLEHAYTLPKMPQPMQKRSSQSVSSEPHSQSASTNTPEKITVTLKSTRNPPLSITLPDLDVGATSVLSLKERIAKELKLDGTGKVKVLWEKKPVSDAKTVREVVGEEKLRELAKEGVELGVMVMGWKDKSEGGDGGGDKMDVDEGGVAPSSSVDDGFWDDLRGFLQQRLKHEKVAEEALEVFRVAWGKR